MKAEWGRRVSGAFIKLSRLGVQGVPAQRKPRPLGAGCGVCPGLHTMPATRRVMLIRHAEEPDKGAGILGVDESGHPDAEALSVRGWQRAGALAGLFAACAGHGAAYRPLAPPMAVFAATDAGKSRRPLCTVQPLARRLGLEVDTRFGSEDALAPVLAAVLACRGPVLVCWRHQAMGDVAQALCGGPARRWDPARFDLVWVFERQGGAWQLTELPQRLLAGDG